MLFTRFSSYARFALLACAFAGLIVLAGCGSKGPSPQQSAVNEPKRAAPPSDEIPSDAMPAADVPAAAAEPLDQSPRTLEGTPAGLVPATPEPPVGAMPALADSTEKPSAPAAAEQQAEGGKAAWNLPPAQSQTAADMTGVAEPESGGAAQPSSMGENAGAVPLRETPPAGAQAGRRSPFAENPLREGTDDFPGRSARPVSAPVSEPPSPSATELAASPGLEKTPEAPKNKNKKKKFGKGKHSDFDPIAENGPIFVGWQKPKLAILISGRQDGYLEPCGCAGLDRMKGGLTRRHSLFKRLRADGWPLVGLDCGGLIKGFGRQAELKFHLSVDAMQTMGYDAIALGKTDLRLPAGELLSRVASSEGAPSPFVSANVAVFVGFAAGMTADHRIVEAGGLRVGVTSVLGEKWQKEINSPDVEMADPAAKLQDLVPKLDDRSDLTVLLAHATIEESLALAREFPQFDLVVTAGGNPVPPKEMQVLDNGTKLIEVGEKGMDAIVLGVYEGGEMRYQRVPLDSRFEDSPDMKEFMRQYQEQLKADGLEGLGIVKPGVPLTPHPQAEQLGRFVGSEKCKDCHEISYDVWKDTGHSDAWQTLVELEIPRTHDPECISCHVVGWHPTDYFPYESGFLSVEETPELVDVGCESCHGPGEKHVEAEMGSDEDLQLKLQKAMVVTKEQAQHDKAHWCIQCHDLDNSPDFNFEEYWPVVEHKEDIWAELEE